MAGALIDDTASPYALIYQNQRRIGTIMPDVTIEEVHHDELVITEHPVEVGAAIADHAFKRPSEVEMRIGFSDSTHQEIGYVKQAYAMLLDLQAQREPFDVSTGKRQYQNMLIRGLAVTTDEKSEFALSCVCSLRQVIITNVGGTGGGGTGAQGNQTNPQSTGQVTNMGSQQLATVSQGQTVFASDFLPGGYQGFPAATSGNLSFVDPNLQTIFQPTTPQAS